METRLVLIAGVPVHSNVTDNHACMITNVKINTALDGIIQMERIRVHAKVIHSCLEFNCTESFQKQTRRKSSFV